LVNFERAEGLATRCAVCVSKDRDGNPPNLKIEPVLRHSGYRHLNESYWRAMKQVRYEPRYCIGSVLAFTSGHSKRASEELKQVPFFSFSPKTKMRPQLLRSLPALLSKATASRVRVKVASQSHPHITIDQPSALWHINTCLDGIQQFLRHVSRPFLDLIFCWLVCNPFKIWL
jgi:hypothetical protein